MITGHESATSSWQKYFDFFINFFNPRSNGAIGVFFLAGGACGGQGRPIPTMVAKKLTLKLMVNKRNTTMGTHETIPTALTKHEWGIPASIEKQHRLLAAFKSFLECFT